MKPRSLLLPDAPSGWLLLACWLVLIAALAAGGLASTAELRALTASKDAVITGRAADLADTIRLRAYVEEEASRTRSYLLTGYEPFLAERALAHAKVQRQTRELAQRLDDPEEEAVLNRIVRRLFEAEPTIQRALQAEREQGQPGAAFESAIGGLRDSLDTDLEQLTQLSQQRLARAQADSERVARRALSTLVAVAAAALLLSTGLALLLSHAFGALRARQEAIAQANRDLDAFAGRVAHDLRNILSGLPLTTGLLRTGNPSPAALAAAGRVDKIARRAANIIEGLLAFARAGQPSPDDSARVDTTLSEALEDLEPARAQVDVTIECEVPAVAVACSPALLAVVFVNVIGNAIKFIAGREVRKVLVRGHAEGGSCVLEIADTGPGIPESALGRIFAPFYRAPGAKAEGTGLGLATVERLVLSHGGSVEVASTVGVGTTFRIRLPLTREAPVLPERRSTPPSTRAAAGSGSAGDVARR